MTRLKRNRIEKARHNRRAFLLLALLLCAAVSGCTPPQERLKDTQDFISANALQPEIIPSRPFPLYSAAPSLTPAKKLTIIIEGDGYAWVDRWTPSDDPTPKIPTGLHIAAALNKAGQANNNPAIYLARPCQYVMRMGQNQGCNAHLWTDQRFNSDVFESYNNALGLLRARYGATAFHLIGYSGGGYIATVLAAMRPDIAKVTTIAAPLDLESWTRYHEVTPIEGPVRLKRILRDSSKTQFVHLCGEKDEIVPCKLYQNLVDQTVTLGLENHKLKMMPGFKHGDAWESLTPYY